LHSSTVILDAAPAGFADCAPLDLAHWPAILADRLLSDGRHIVLGDAGGPHHLWTRDPRPGQPLAYIIPHDAAVGERTAATERFDRRRSGVPASRCPGTSHPTQFKARRLSLLLAVLDALLNVGDRPNTHEIASQLIYPHMTIGRGAEWKASSERRRTQRVIDEALALMHGGYRALLRGIQPVRQKPRA
jgi:hypothetical protein